LDQQGGDDKIGGTEPKTFRRLRRLLDKAKAAGVIPLALAARTGRKPPCSIRSCVGPADLSSTRRPSTISTTLRQSDTMKKSFDNLAKLVTNVDPNFSGRDWNLATAMVIKGDALVQVMGDWAKGEFHAANKTPGTDFLCYRFPGTDGSVIYNSDMFGMFNVPDDRKAAQVALATATLSKSFRRPSTSSKVSVPARTDVPDTDFDACGKKGIADLKAATTAARCSARLAQGYGAPPAVANPTRTSCRSSSMVRSDSRSRDRTGQGNRSRTACRRRWLPSGRRCPSCRKRQSPVSETSVRAGTEL